MKTYQSTQYSEKQHSETKSGKFRRRLTALFAILAIMFFTQQCKKENDFAELPCDASVPGAMTPIPFTVLSDSAEDAECHTKLVEFGPEWKEFISMDPQGSAIWPGAALVFPSVQTGGYTPLAGDRRPLTISVSLPGIAGNAGRTMEQPSLSSSRTAMNDLLQQQLQGAATPAQIAWTQTEIYNERHFKLAIGGNYGNLIMDLNAQVNYNSNSVRGRYLFQYTQVYYSVDVDVPPAGVENFFSKVPSCGQMGGYSPAYVSSVKYGRKVFLMIESSKYDYSAMADIRGEFDAFFASGELNINSKLSNLISENSIKGVIIGGPSYEGIKVVNNPEQLKDYLLAGANFDMSSPGVPLSYTLRFMKDNSVASIVKYDKFTIRECTVIPASSNTIKTTPGDLTEKRLYRIDGDQDFAGNGPIMKVTVTYTAENSNKELWQNVTVIMKEKGGDHTTGQYSDSRKVWTAPSGKKIIDFSNELSGSKTQTFEYEDIGHGMDAYDFSASKLINSITWLGDTDGDDVTAGTITDITKWSHLHSLKFNPVKIKYQ